MNREEYENEIIEDNVKKEFLFSIGDLLKNRNSKKSRINSREQELATEIYEFFKKELPYPRIMKAIRENGFQCIFEIFSEVKRPLVKNPLALFIWLVNKNRTIFKKLSPS